MIVMFIVFGAANIALFLLYSRKVGSVVNAITVYTGLKLVIEFVLEPLAYMLNLFVYDFRSIFLINLLSFCGYAAFVLGLLITKQAPNPPRTFFRPNYLGVAWLLLAGAWALYAPVLIEFRSIITEPRRIYELTRTGYGVYTFGSALLTFVAYIVFQMSSKRQALLFYLPLLTLMVLKGAKGQFIILGAIFVIAKVYLEGFKYSLTRSVVYGALAGIALVYLFAFNYRGEINNVFVTIAEYSDYNRNGALVLQDGTSGYYRGQITLENLWIPKIPRALWPNKPKIFGEFRLAVQYFPSWFLLDQGSPSFGIGIYFADFGWWAFFVYTVLQLLSGYLLGYSLNRLIVNPNAFYFVISVYLSGSNLLASGNGAYFIEHAIIGLGLALLLGIVNAGSRGHPRQDDDPAPASTTALQGGDA